MNHFKPTVHSSLSLSLVSLLLAGACKSETQSQTRTSVETNVRQPVEQPSDGGSRVSVGLPLFDEPLIVVAGRPRNAFRSSTNPKLVFVYADLLDWDRDANGKPYGSLYLSPEFNMFTLAATYRHSPELKLRLDILADEGFEIRGMLYSQQHLELTRASLFFADAFEAGPLPLRQDFTKFRDSALYAQYKLSDHGVYAVETAREDALGLKSIFEVKTCRTFSGLSTGPGGEHQPVLREFCVRLDSLNEILEPGDALQDPRPTQ